MNTTNVQMISIVLVFNMKTYWKIFLYKSNDFIIKDINKALNHFNFCIKQYTLQNPKNKNVRKGMNISDTKT